MANNEKKRSFFEKLTGSIRMKDDDSALPVLKPAPQGGGTRIMAHEEGAPNPWANPAAALPPEEEAEGELTLDVYQTPTDIIVQTFVAGVRPEDLEINITRDMLTIRGKRQEKQAIADEDFFSRELYWGSFSRTVSLPQEIEPEQAEAIERHGLLTIRLPKINKDKRSNLKVKSI